MEKLSQKTKSSILGCISRVPKRAVNEHAVQRLLIAKADPNSDEARTAVFCDDAWRLADSVDDLIKLSYRNTGRHLPLFLRFTQLRYSEFTCRALVASGAQIELDVGQSAEAMREIGPARFMRIVSLGGLSVLLTVLEEGKYSDDPPLWIDGVPVRANLHRKELKRVAQQALSIHVHGMGEHLIPDLANIVYSFLWKDLQVAF